MVVCVPLEFRLRWDVTCDAKMRPVVEGQRWLAVALRAERIKLIFTIVRIMMKGMVTIPTIRPAKLFTSPMGLNTIGLRAIRVRGKFCIENYRTPNRSADY